MFDELRRLLRNYEYYGATETPSGYFCLDLCMQHFAADQ